MPEFTAESLKSKTQEELAILAERNNPLSSEGVLLSREFDRRLMKEQQEMNRRTVLLSVVCSAVLGMLGIILGAFLQDHLGKTREAHMPQTYQNMSTTEASKTPQQEAHVAATKQQSVSKPPPKGKNGQNR